MVDGRDLDVLHYPQSIGEGNEWLYEMCLFSFSIPLQGMYSFSIGHTTRLDCQITGRSLGEV